MLKSFLTLFFQRNERKEQATFATILNNLAETNPLIGGMAVYMARSLLFREIHDQPLEGNLRKAIIKQVTNSSIKNLEVFPNPATNFINFTDDNELQGSKVIITDVTGRMVFNSEYKKRIAINHIEPGTYLIQIITVNSETYQSKFLKL